MPSRRSTKTPDWIPLPRISRFHRRRSTAKIPRQYHWWSSLPSVETNARATGIIGPLELAPTTATSFPPPAAMSNTENCAPAKRSAHVSPSADLWMIPVHDVRSALKRCPVAQNKPSAKVPPIYTSDGLPRCATHSVPLVDTRRVPSSPSATNLPSPYSTVRNHAVAGTDAPVHELGVLAIAANAESSHNRGTRNLRSIDTSNRRIRLSHATLPETIAAQSELPLTIG